MNSSHRHKHTRTHTHSGGHFQPINSEWAQSRIENNLYQSKAGLDNSSNDPPSPHLNAWLLTGPFFHFSSQKFPHAHLSCLVLSCRTLETVAVIITETAPVLEGPIENKLAMGCANLISVVICLMVEPQLASAFVLQDVHADPQSRHWGFVVQLVALGADFQAHFCVFHLSAEPELPFHRQK